MIPVDYVSDGERDRRMLPAFVERWIGPHSVASFTPWSRVQLQGSFGKGRRLGFERKLRFVIARASSQGHGVIATVDEDGADGRLDELRAARAAEAGTVPVAIGQAVPHGEAWLIDDLEALRECAGFDPHAPRPDPRNPKRAFEAIVDAAGLDLLDAIEQLARAVDLSRCANARATGFEAFARDVRDQFAPGR